jgi:C-8 sterol isomerase
MKRLFDVETLHAVAREAAGRDLPREERIATLVEALDARWPGRIERRPRWILNSANGALGTLTILYASLTEYLIVFGSPIGTEGHSGRYPATVHDFVFEGEMWAYLEGDTERTVYRPGDHAVLPARRAKGYCLRENAWMLEYAEGCIPAMLPPGVWDNLFSNLDLSSLARTFRDYGRLTIRELLRGKL